ncbi:FAD:protein FMN transferase [uncultured Roseobacter sp.]|uniref:FAD:protein FMN transferase n=1 Tax=uncultured Roseobacter sp. TaxID=114847 RepID=UPI0026157862|nr:FAD:protein FMN transferase [uncultured Roseobacter sp.]
MILSRRRFLTISAGFACAPGFAQAHTWQGRAFGADVSITLRGSKAQTIVALRKARAQIAEIEKLFSLHDPASALSQLNTTGALHSPDSRFVALMQAADHAFTVTDGLFDPTVQTLWHAIAAGEDIDVAQRAVGWHKVRFDAQKITLGTGQALTFNGIAQGFATDEITQTLKAHGLQNVLVNIGEYRAIGGPWRLGLGDPTWGHLGTRTVTDTAIATSSPGAMSLGRADHILHPAAQPQWSTVSVEATTATLADSLSTALVLAPLDQITTIKQASRDLGRITLVSGQGEVTTI